MEPAERETPFRVKKVVSSNRDWRVESPDPCSASWPGLECKSAGGGGVGMSGGIAALPSRGVLLPHLQSLFFVDCFTNPAAATTLSLPAPANLSAFGLQQLSFRANPALSGKMPPVLASIRSLQVLTISQNDLVRGEIPPCIGDLTALVRLDLSYNSLSRPVPSQIGQLKSLVGLDLSYNSLSDTVPAGSATCGSCRSWASAPTMAWTRRHPGQRRQDANLTPLTFLALSNNGMSVRFPPGISALRNLQYLIGSVGGRRDFLERRVAA